MDGDHLSINSVNSDDEVEEDRPPTTEAEQKEREIEREVEKQKDRRRKKDDPNATRDSDWVETLCDLNPYTPRHGVDIQVMTVTESEKGSEENVSKRASNPAQMDTLQSENQEQSIISDGRVLEDEQHEHFYANVKVITPPPSTGQDQPVDEHSVATDPSKLSMVDACSHGSRRSSIEAMSSHLMRTNKVTPTSDFHSQGKILRAEEVTCCDCCHTHPLVPAFIRRRAKLLNKKKQLKEEIHNIDEEVVLLKKYSKTAQCGKSNRKDYVGDYIHNLEDDKHRLQDKEKHVEDELKHMQQHQH